MDWDKEKLDNQERIITATKQENMDILEVEIYQFDKNFLLKKKFIATKPILKILNGF